MGELVASKNGIRPQRGPRIADRCVCVLAEVPLFLGLTRCTWSYMLLQEYTHILKLTFEFGQNMSESPWQCLNAFGRFCCSQHNLAALCNNSSCRPTLVHEGFGGCNQLGPSPELGF